MVRRVTENSLVRRGLIRYRFASACFVLPIFMFVCNRVSSLFVMLHLSVFLTFYRCKREEKKREFYYICTKYQDDWIIAGYSWNYTIPDGQKQLEIGYV